MLHQTFPMEKFEILVVDNDSNDKTGEKVKEAEVKLKNLRYLFTAVPGLHAARHMGMKESRSEILAYIDDDVEVAPTWLEAIAEGFSRPEVAMLGGKSLPKFESAPPRWLMKRWTTPNGPGYFLGALSILDFGETVKEILPIYVIGCNFAIRKQTLLAVGGFHPDSLPAEFLFYRGDGETWVGRTVAAHGGKVLYHPQATVYHYVPAMRMTVDYFYRRNFAEGITHSFVQLRKINNIGNSLPDDPPPARLWRQRIYSFMQQAAMTLPFHHHLQRIEKKGFRDGYRCHQERFQKDQELRAWVLKPDWLNS
jgi:glycosyltransferase involved in cell wall biosynthesis